MRRIKTVILMIFVVVFCLQAREVVNVSNSTTTSYNINSGEITSTREQKSEYEYDSEGLLKQITSHIKNTSGIFVKNTVTEFDVYGNIQRLATYGANGNITLDVLNRHIVNSMGFLEKQESEIHLDGELYVKGVSHFEYNYNGDTIKATHNTLNANGDLLNIRVISYEYSSDGNTRFAITKIHDNNENLILNQNSKDIFNSEGLIIITITYDSQDREWNKTETEYNSKGLATKITQYARNNNTNSLVKQSEQVFAYTFKEIIPTAINAKQIAQTQNNFQINRTANSLNLNFSDNSQKRIEIVNMQGRILASQNFSAKIHNVNISSLSRNIYILRVFENERASSVRFVK